MRCGTMHPMKKHGCQYLESLPADAVEIPGYAKSYATPRGEIITQHGRTKLRKFGRNGAGYPICGLCRDDGKKHFVLVHRIIAKLFVPGDQSLTVNHKDLDKSNTSASNLEWISFSDNHKHARALKGNWSKDNGQKKAITAINPDTGERKEFPSVRAAAVFCGQLHMAGNISRACRLGLVAYGFEWKAA